MSEPRRYEIRTLSDFAKVPKRRLRACLREFATSIEMQAATAKLLNAVAKELHGTSDSAIAVAMDSFVWIDDGAKNITMRLNGHDGE